MQIIANLLLGRALSAAHIKSSVLLRMRYAAGTPHMGCRTPCLCQYRWKLGVAFCLQPNITYLDDIQSNTWINGNKVLQKQVSLSHTNISADCRKRRVHKVISRNVSKPSPARAAKVKANYYTSLNLVRRNKQHGNDATATSSLAASVEPESHCCLLYTSPSPRDA